MFKRVLVANRGEIARRIIRTAKRLGLETVAVYSDPDRSSLHVSEAERAVWIGPAPAAESYLSQEAILGAARAAGVDAVHPGYGFLSENPDFAAAVAAAGIEFIGPSAESIRLMGLKDAAKQAMQGAGVPTVPGFCHTNLDDEAMASEAEQLGFPVLIKAVAGGGGKGMRIIRRREDFRTGLNSARAEAKSAFGNEDMLVEKLVQFPRHIEVQVFGDKMGNVVHLFERDCSVQRRHQKIIEEAPAPGLSAEAREALGETAVRAARSIGYVGAGTVEFVADGSSEVNPDRCWFLEMNTRLQVEHPVTELITDVDLVEWQFRVAAGEQLPLAQAELAFHGCAMEARLYAEDVGRGFLPSSGRLTRVQFPSGIRVESGVQAGDAVSPHYDPMIAKLVARGATRDEARERLAAGLDATVVLGPATNIGFLGAVLQNERFSAGAVNSDFVEQEFGTFGGEDQASAEAVALAALAAAGLGRGGEADSGFALWHPARWEVQLERNDQVLQATLAVDSRTSALVTVGGRAFRCRLESGQWRVNGRLAAAPPAVQGGKLCVALDGYWEFCVLDPLAREIEGRDEGSATRSPMPGTVRSLHVVSGQAVDRGSPIAVVEAMKMEHTVVAAHSGTVDEVLVEVGDQVEEGTSLVRFGDCGAT